MIIQRKLKRLILHITSTTNVFYAECRPVLPQVRLTATTVKDAEREAYTRLRRALHEHLDIVP